MTDIVLIFVLVIILGSAGGFIYKAKKKGQVCIGCPHAKTCSAHSCRQAHSAVQEEE